MSIAPVSRKSLTLRVMTCIPWRMAVAAMMPSYLMGPRSSSVERDDRWQDTGCGRDDAGSECGASVNRSSRHGESYESYLKELARKSGIEEPSGADIAKLDKKRPKKGSNKEWVNPNEPDAEIMKMKTETVLDMSHVVGPQR